MLRNCGKELMYESPQSRTDTAHIIWDKLLASGNYNELDSMDTGILQAVTHKNKFHLTHPFLRHHKQYFVRGHLVRVPTILYIGVETLYIL